jgi:hypothetical protein
MHFFLRDGGVHNVNNFPLLRSALFHFNWSYNFWTLIMKFLIFVLLLLFSIQSFAINGDPYLLERTVRTYQAQEEFARNKKVYVESVRKIRENAPIPDSVKQNAKNLVERSIAVDKPTSQKMGQSYLQRLKGLSKLTGPALAGTLATTALLESVGWVMDDGILVKYKEKEEEDLKGEFYWPSYDKKFADPMSAFNYWKSKNTTRGEITVKSLSYKNNGNTAVVDYTYFMLPKRPTDITPSEATQGFNREKNPNYDPTPQDKEKVKLTAEQAGSAMLGEGYRDPVDSTRNKEINKGIWTGVASAYEPDPSDIGNELPDQMDDRAKKSKPTSDGKPAPFADPKYDDLSPENPPLENDRWWPQDGNEATGDITQDKDEDGNPTGDSSVSLEFPVFCTWASRMCEWADDWISSDKVYKDHMTQTEEHQSQEKSFWDKVTDFFKFFTEKDDHDDEETEVEIIDDKPPTLNKDLFQASGQCPPDFIYPFPLPFGGSYNVTYSYATACIWFSKLYYVVLLVSSIIGLKIVTGVDGNKDG